MKIEIDVKDHKFDHEIVVSANGDMLVRFVVEEGSRETTIFMEQCGVGMIDGMGSMQMLESEKRKCSSKLFGGHYGLGLKQVLAVIASRLKHDWKFSMFGTVHHAVSGQFGWSRLWTSEVENQLTVHGEVSFQGIPVQV